MTSETLNLWGAAWFDFMLTALVDGAVLLVAVALVWLAWQRRASAQVGHLLFLLVIVHLATPFVLPVAASLGWLSPREAGTRVWRLLANRSEPRRIDQQTEQEKPADATKMLSALTAHADLLPRQAATDVATVSRRSRLSGQAWLMLGWCAAVAVLVSRLTWVQWSTMRHLRGAQPIERQRLGVDVRSLGRRLGLRRAVSVATTSAIGSPVVWGLWRPRLLLPPGLADRLPPKQLEWVLLHELAHVRRGDLWIALVQRLVQIAYFFHPAVWLANWQIDRLREFACDDAALAAAGGTGRDCATALVSVAEWACGPSPQPALGLFHSASLLRKRVIRLSDRKRRDAQPLSILSAALLGIVAILVLPHVRAENGPPTKETPRQADTASPNADAKAPDPIASKTTQTDAAPSGDDEVDAGELPPLEQRVAALKTIEAAGGHAWPDMEKLRAARLDHDSRNPKHRFQQASLHRVAITDKVLDALAAFPELEQLILWESGVTDDQLARLPLRNLKYLNLSDTPISNQGLKHLRSLVKLRSLVLTRTAVTDRGLVPLARLTDLEELDLDETAVGDEGVADLADLPKLAALSLRKTAIGDAALKYLQNRTSLRHLDLRGTKVTDLGLISLQGLAELTTLRLDDTGVSDAGIEIIERLASVTELTLGNTQVTDASAAAIARWADLTRLDLRHTAFSELGVKRLAELRKLVFLDLAGTKISDASLLALGGMDKLRELDLADTPIGDAGLRFLQPLPSLWRLDLSGTQISDARLEALKLLPRLAFVNVQGTQITALDVFRAVPRTNPNVAKILSALDDKTELDFSDQPLADVIEYFQTRHEINIQLDHKSLSDLGVDSSTPITMKLRGIMLREALESLLSPHGLTFGVRHEVLLIAAKPLPDKVSDLPVVPAGQRLSPKLAEAFMQRTELDFRERPLVRVIEFLAQKHNLDMQLDAASLAKGGIGFDVPITRNIKGITLKSGLELLLDEL
ncbi:MAG TPA: M56 family metallopeptidase, partial [Pirellulales bacterium]|nr:M56 family metallopeptidase [Pirellulales bacterium]